MGEDGCKIRESPGRKRRCRTNPVSDDRGPPRYPVQTGLFTGTVPPRSRGWVDVVRGTSREGRGSGGRRRRYPNTNGAGVRPEAQRVGRYEKDKGKRVRPRRGRPHQGRRHPSGVPSCRGRATGGPDKGAETNEKGTDPTICQLLFLGK